MTTARDAITTATVVRSDATSAPARFALELRSGQDPVAQAVEVQAALAPLRAAVAPLSALEPEVLVVEFPDRLLRPDPAAAFGAAHELRAQFDLAAAEPDLPTAFFPEAGRIGDGKDPGRESVDGFPLGCWGPEDPALDPRWALQAMRVPEAWAFSEARQRPSRGAGVVVAQPDTGVTAHPELAGVAVVPGRDILGDDPDPTDPLGGGNPGHGTATASVLVSPESLVVAGTAPLARHMPIRAIESVIRITQVTVARAIDFAVAGGAQVITMSLGGLPSFSLNRALRRAVAADVIVLAAAGNCVRTVVWPARYDDCIAVAGTNVRGEPWRGSCRGDAVDISAPAENVIRARIGAPAVGQGQGTSFSVALTAGVAALWLAHHGRANLVAAARDRGETLQVMFRRLVRATAHRPGRWDSSEMGAGIVNARALLAADLDLGRNQETVSPPAERVAGSVESLVAEAFGPDAVDGTLDWHRYGPEVATAVLQLRLASAPGDTLPEGPPRTTVTEQLAAAVGNPVLRERLGLPAIPQRAAPETMSGNAQQPVEMEALRPPSYYDGYSGYDPMFLQTELPLPVLTEEQRRNAAKRSGAASGEDPTVLPYTHFSVVINRVRQLAYYTVVNIDGTKLVDLPRSRDRWFFDPRIAESEQIGEELYRRNKLDRGHLVRRLDPVWGPEPARSNDDTFHFTNCAPQHERFNQGSDLWQGLENYILDHADMRGRRITVFTGPVLDDDDPLYKGVRLPLAYWKIIAYDRPDGSLAVAAYVLEQAKLIEDLLRAEALFEPGGFRITLAHLRERTGFDFRYLRDAELPLSSDGLETVADRVRIRDDYSNLVL